MDDKDPTRIMGDQGIQFLPDFQEAVSGNSLYIVGVAIREQDNGLCVLTGGLAEYQIQPILVGNCPVFKFIVSACCGKVVVIVRGQVKGAEKDRAFRPVEIFGKRRKTAA